MRMKTNNDGRQVRFSLAVVAEALNLAAQDAVELHQRAGQPLAVWKDGQTVLIPPESVQPATSPPKRRRRKS
ncbi:MAG: hypothetical protein ACKV0T_01580 [Planctomycetales bacterium]